MNKNRAIIAVFWVVTNISVWIGVAFANWYIEGPTYKENVLMNPGMKLLVDTLLTAFLSIFAGIFWAECGEKGTDG